MERFVVIFNGFQPLTIITKHSIFDVAAVLDPPLTSHNIHELIENILTHIKTFSVSNRDLAVVESTCSDMISTNFTLENNADFPPTDFVNKLIDIKAT